MICDDFVAELRLLEDALARRQRREFAKLEAKIQYPSCGPTVPSGCVDEGDLGRLNVPNKNFKILHRSFSESSSIGLPQGAQVAFSCSLLQMPPTAIKPMCGSTVGVQSPEPLNGYPVGSDQNIEDMETPFLHIQGEKIVEGDVFEDEADMEETEAQQSEDGSDVGFRTSSANTVSFHAADIVEISSSTPTLHRGESRRSIRSELLSANVEQLLYGSSNKEKEKLMSLMENSKDEVDEEQKPRGSRTSMRGSGRKSSHCSGGDDENDLSLLDQIAEAEREARLSKLRAFVSHPTFDVFFSIVVLVNTVLIGVQMDYVIRHGSDNLFFKAAELVCTAIFTIELLLRLAASNCRLFSDSWMLFDATLVILALSDFGLTLFVGESPSASLTGVFKIFRIARIMRIVRMVRLLTEVRLMAMMIVGSMQALFWLFLLILLIMYTFSVVLSQGILDFRKKSVDLDTDLHDGIVMAFGSISRSLYTLFMSSTGGVSWGEPASYAYACGFPYLACFTFYIFFVFFSVLNIVNGVFVDGAIQYGNNDRSIRITKELDQRRAFLADMLEILERMDVDGSGCITQEEWEEALATEDFAAQISVLGLDTKDIGVLFELIDADGNGLVSIVELVEGFHRLKGPAHSIDMHQCITRVNKVLTQVEKVSQELEFIRQAMPGAGPTDQHVLSRTPEISPHRLMQDADHHKERPSIERQNSRLRHLTNIRQN